MTSNINQRPGNLITEVLQGNVDVMMHVCNDQGVMGSGIAKEVRDRIPEAYAAYTRKFSIGCVSACSNVINLVAQRGYGKGIRHLDYEVLYTCLEKARARLEKLDPQREWRIGIPYKMGSDRAGGNWSIVLSMVCAVFDDPRFEINIIKYK